MGGLLHGITDWAKDVIESLGYAGIAVLIVLENVFPPIPSEAILPLAGFLAGEGRFWLPAVIFAATVGAVLGALVLYAAGVWFGDARLRRLTRRYGRWLAIEEGDLDKANAWFDRHGGKAVMICRLVPIVRSLVSIPAGLRQMPLLPFVLYTAIGSGLWNSVLILSGWWLGENWETVGDYVGLLEYPVIATVVGGAIWFLWKRKIIGSSGIAA